LSRGAGSFTFIALVAALSGLGCKSKKDAASVTLSESYTVASELAVVRYPPDFTPSQASALVAALTPLPASAYDDAVELHFGTNVRPSTNVVDEYARILHKNFQEGHPDWKEESRAEVTCFKGFTGVEIVATFTGKKGKKLRYRSCSFFASGHGFWLAYMAPEKTFAEDEPLLRKIVDATEVRP
jgi:hypothetical protein